MSITLMSTIFAVKGQLTPTEKLLLLELSDHANDQGGGIWPGRETIMERTSLSRSAVKDTLQFLTEARILDTVEEATPNSSTKRQINVRMLEQMVEYGKRDETHPALAAARAQWAEKEAQKRAEKAAREDQKPPQGGGLPGDPGLPGNPPGVATQPTQGCQATHQGCVAPHRGLPGNPESLINHQLNIQEPNGILSAPPPKTSPPVPEAGEMWEMVVGQLHLQMRRSEYEAWIANLRAVGYQNGVFVLACKNAYNRDWVVSRVGKTIENLLTPIAMQPVRLVVQVNPGL